MSEWKPPKFGSPCWMAIPATDVERAAKFYKDVFDWTFRPPTDKYPTSHISMFEFRPDVELSGGIIKSPDKETKLMKPAAAGVCMYWMVEDVDATIAAVEKAGGKVLTGRVKEGDMGVYRVFEDTEGNLGGAYQVVSAAASAGSS